MLAESLKNLMLAGLGAAVITKEKLDSLTAELVEKGRLSKDEAQKISDDLIDQAGRQAQALSEKVEQTAREAVEGLNLASAEKVAELEKRLAALEEKVAGLSEKSNTG